MLIEKLANDVCEVHCDVDYYMAPMANPDGYEYSRTEHRLWRKNRATNNGDTCQGVDLNRNWSFNYTIGASPSPCSDVYYGANAFSEPETKALSDAMTAVENLKLVLSLHSYGQKMLYPWGWTATPPENVNNLISAGKAFADAVYAHSGRVYTVENSAGGLYFASGATDDWAMKMISVPYVYTLELRDDGTHGFVLPADQIQPTGDETSAGLSALLTKIKSLDAA